MKSQVIIFPPTQSVKPNLQEQVFQIINHTTHYLSCRKSTDMHLFFHFSIFNCSIVVSLKKKDKTVFFVTCKFPPNKSTVYSLIPSCCRFVNIHNAISTTKIRLHVIRKKVHLYCERLYQCFFRQRCQTMHQNEAMVLLMPPS